MLSKLDFVVVAAVAGGMLWIEHEHRINLLTPAAVEAAGSDASACPDNDSIPFSADCIAFIRGGVAQDVHVHVRAQLAPTAAPPETHRHAELSAPACPSSNENAPYSANCLRFLSGWYWQPDRTP